MNESLHVPLQTVAVNTSLHRASHFDIMTPKRHPTRKKHGLFFCFYLRTSVVKQAWKDQIDQHVQQVKTDSTHWPLTPSTSLLAETFVCIETSGCRFSPLDPQ